MAEIIPNLDNREPIENVEHQAPTPETSAEQVDQIREQLGTNVASTKENHGDLPVEDQFLGRSEEDTIVSEVTDSAVIPLQVATPNAIITEMISNDIMDPFEANVAATGYADGIEKK